MQYIRSQFANPRGPIGHLAGMLMAHMNHELNQWAISILNIQADDHVLEIGFGPGEGIQQVIKLAHTGFVAGIDISETMLQQAHDRNILAINNKQVELKTGSVAHIPYADQTFNKLLAVNSVQEWPHLENNLLELLRVLKPAGTAVITSQPRWIKSNKEAEQFGKTIITAMANAGFQNTHLATKSMQPILAVSAVGTKHDGVNKNGN